MDVASRSTQLQRDLKQMCGESVLFWINMFCWTYRQHDVLPDGTEVGAQVNHVPFVTWRAQDEAILEMREALAVGDDVIFSKSRQEGATWVCIADNHHLWQFRPEAQILEVSRTEDYIDKSGSALSLFWKHDYINSYQPAWLLPCKLEDLIKKGKPFRKDKVILNPELGGAITGTATTEHIGKGGHWLRGFYDEMAMIDNARAAWSSSASACVQRVANSTPYGPGTEYSRLRREGLKTGHPRVLPLMYYNNPERGMDRQWVVDTDGSVTGEAGRQFWDCKWLRRRVEKAEGDQIDIGQNIFADDIMSGDTVFNPAMVTQHRELHSRDPEPCELNEDGTAFVKSPGGRWRIWAELAPSSKHRGEWIIARHTFNDFVAFLDPSYGKGSSNTAAAFMNRDTNEILAEFIDPFCSPTEVADELVPALRGVFKGSRGPCYIGWEENGPGESLWLEFVNRLKFRRVYQRRKLGTRLDGRSRNYGWRSGRREKRVLLQRLGGAVKRDDIRIYSHPGCSEMLEYVFFPDGSCGPGVHRDETSGAREAHGDRVIAYAGCLFMKREVAKMEGKKQTKYPAGTLGHFLGHNEILGAS